MKIPRMIILALILGLLDQLFAYAEQPLKLEAKESTYQFPFFDTQTPVWSYNGRIPGPVIQGCLIRNSIAVAITAAGDTIADHNLLAFLIFYKKVIFS